jgi:hypothetical protein
LFSLLLQSLQAEEGQQELTQLIVEILSILCDELLQVGLAGLHQALLDVPLEFFLHFRGHW